MLLNTEFMEKREKHWHKIIAKETHLGTKTSMDQVLFMCDYDTVRVMDRYLIEARKEKGKGRGLSEKYYSMRELNPDEEIIFEKDLERRNLDPEKAKRLIIRYRAMGDELPPV
jgi:hypothetical protein